MDRPINLVPRQLQSLLALSGWITHHLFEKALFKAFIMLINSLIRLSINSALYGCANRLEMHVLFFVSLAYHLGRLAFTCHLSIFNWIIWLWSKIY